MNTTCHHSTAVYRCTACIARVRHQMPEFPLQRSRNTPPGPDTVPWSVAEKAWAAYAAQYGTQQSVERMAERGGFAWSEMDTLFPGWREATDKWLVLEKKNQAYAAELSDYIRAGAEAATILAGEGGPLGEGLVAGATRVVQERDAMRAKVAALEVENERMRRRPRCDDPNHRLIEADWDELAGRCAGAEQAEKELRAELARLKPSGQVAEDMEILKAAIRHADWNPEQCSTCAALNRLATRAQQATDAPSTAEDANILKGGANERARLLFDAKNHWAARARAAEHVISEIRKRATHWAGRGEGIPAVVASSISALILWVVSGDAAEDGAGPKHDAPLEWRPATDNEKTAFQIGLEEGEEKGRDDMEKAIHEGVRCVFEEEGMLESPIWEKVQRAISEATP